MSDIAAVVFVVLCKSKCKDGIFSIQKFAFILQLFQILLINIFDTNQLFILLNRIVQCLLMKFLAKFLFFQQSDQLFIGLYLWFFLLFFFHLLLFLLYYLMGQIHISQHLFVFLFALSVVVLENIVYFGVLFTYFLLYCVEANKNLHDFFVLIAVKVLFLQNLCDKLVDMPLPYLFFEVAKFIVHCILSQILILLQPCHNRTERILLVMQIFP